MIFTCCSLHAAISMVLSFYACIYLHATSQGCTRLSLDFCSGMGCIFQLQVTISGPWQAQKAMEEIKRQIKLTYSSCPSLYHYDQYLSGISDWYFELKTLSPQTCAVTRSQTERLERPKQSDVVTKVSNQWNRILQTSLSVGGLYGTPSCLGPDGSGLIHDAAMATWNCP